MNIVKNGESSTSPLRHTIDLAANGSGDNHDTQHSETGAQISNGGRSGRLVLPQWDEYPLRAIHASQDMITLLNLDGLYNTHVLPYADVVNDDGPNEGGGMGGNTGRKKAKMKMEKGYQHLLPDCIDPIPAGDKRDSLALLPLMGDYDQPPTAPPELPEGPLVSLGEDAYRVARLEPGTQDGYEKGEKKGVRDAEAKRQRRRENRKAQSMSVGPEGLSLPSPALVAFDHPTPSSPGIPPPPPAHYTPRPPHARAGSLGTPRGGTPGTPSRGGGHHLGKRPFEGHGGGGTPKRGRGSGFRIGSETPRGRGRPNYPQGFRAKTDY